MFLVKFNQQTFSSNEQFTRASVNVSARPNFFVRSIILGLALIPTAEINVARISMNQLHDEIEDDCKQTEFILIIVLFLLLLLALFFLLFFFGICLEEKCSRENKFLTILILIITNEIGDNEEKR